MEEAESEIDDYAIPDELESYVSNRDYVSAKGMTINRKLMKTGMVNTGRIWC